LNDRDSIFTAVKGSSVVFGVTNYWEKMSMELEIAQGKNIADACKETKVERFVWSSLVNVTKETHGKITSVNTLTAKPRLRHM